MVVARGVVTCSGKSWLLKEFTMSMQDDLVAEWVDLRKSWLQDQLVVRSYGYRKS